MIHPGEILTEIARRLSVHEEFLMQSPDVSTTQRLVVQGEASSLESLKAWINQVISERLDEMEAATPAPAIDEYDTLPPLQEGQCSNYREHGLNCGQAKGHEGDCQDTGPFATQK